MKKNRIVLFMLVGLLLVSKLTIASVNMPFAVGETLNYDIKKMHVTVGTASFVYKGEVDLNGAKAHLMIFTANALNFLDEELIYFDPQTYYPIMVKRNLDLWGRKEAIVETYDPQSGVVHIEKTVKGKIEHFTIEKKGQLDNIYCFMYRYRHLGGFDLGSKLSLNLPTRDVVFQLKDRRDIKIQKKNLSSFYMQSNPKQYRIWFKSDQSKIPLRIDGAMGLGKTVLILKSYHP